MVKPPKPPSFESAVSELETIVQEMENGQLPLEHALVQQGCATLLLHQCQEILGKAEQTIRVLESTDTEAPPA